MKESFHFNFSSFLHRQAEWAIKTFGPGRNIKGVIAHIRQELEEIESDPDDILEWIDVIFLALDGARKRGFTPNQIIAALSDKQIMNEKRKWPDWRTIPDGQSINHIKETQ